MRHRAHDHLFAAAGVTAALSLMGTGVIVLKGSVLQFDAWPLVASNQPRKVQLPVAPIVAQPTATALARQSVFGAPGGDAAGLVPGGVPTSLSAAIAAGTPGAGGVRSLGFSVPAGQQVRPGIVVRGTTGVSVTVDGTAGSVGSQGTNEIDGTATPVASVPGVTGTTRNAPPGTADVDGDGVPDTWQIDHGTPGTATQTVSSPGVQARDTASAFRADPPATLPAETEQPAPTTDTPPAEPPTDTTPPAETDPVPVDQPTTDQPAPTTDPVPSDPAPPADSTSTDTPSDSAPAADGSTTADPAPAEPAPADPAPPADPEPAPAPETAPAPEPAPEPATTTTTSDTTASATSDSTTPPATS